MKKFIDTSHPAGIIWASSSPAGIHSFFVSKKKSDTSSLLSLPKPEPHHPTLSFAFEVLRGAEIRA